MTKGKVTGVVGNLVTVEVNGPVGQNEICYILLGTTKLMAEVIKIIGNIAYAQATSLRRFMRRSSVLKMRSFAPSLCQERTHSR